MRSSIEEMLETKFIAGSIHDEIDLRNKETSVSNETTEVAREYSKESRQLQLRKCSREKSPE